MRFACDSCRAQYMISDEKVGPRGVKVRCKKCGHAIVVRRAGADAVRAESAPVEEDAQETQVLMRPDLAANREGDDDGDQTVALPNSFSPQTGGVKAVLGQVDEDEIGAVFDQVLSGGNQALAGSAAGEEGGEDRASTRVVDAAVVQKLAAKTADDDDADELRGEETAPVPLEDWFLAIDEKQQGPMSLAHMKGLWDRGEVGPDTLCWRMGFADWTPLSQVDMLAKELVPRPAKPVIVAPASDHQSGGLVPVAVESAFSSGGVSQSVRTEVPMPVGDGAEASAVWRPSAGSALASLIQEEKQAIARPTAPSAHSAPLASATDPSGPIVRSLLDIPSAPDPSAPRPSPHSPSSGAAVHPSAPRGYGVPAGYVPPTTTGATRNPLVWLMVIMGGVVVLTLVVVIVILVTRDNAPVPAPVAAAAAPVPSPVAVAPPIAAQVPPVASPAAVVPAAGPTAVAAALPPEPPPQDVTREVPTADRPKFQLGGSAKSTREGRSTRSSGSRREEAAAAAPVAAVAPKPPSEDDDFERTFGGGTAKPEGKGAATGSSGDPSTKRTVFVPDAPGGAGDLKETLGQSDVMEVVLAHKPQLTRCVQEQREREPGVTGTLRLRWSIQTSGKVSSVSVASEEFKQTHVASCISALVKSWVFPRHKVAADPVVFPFKF